MAGILKLSEEFGTSKNGKIYMSKFTFQLQSTMFDATPQEAKLYAQQCANFHKTKLTMLVHLGHRWLKYKTFYPTE